MLGRSTMAACPGPAARSVWLAVAGLPLIVALGAEAGAVEWPAPLRDMGVDAWAAYLEAAIRRGFAREPAAMVGVAAAALVPLLAVSAAMARWLSRLGRWGVVAARQAPGPLHAGPLAMHEARLVVADRSAEAAPLAIGELTRIGSSAECELALEGSGLSETHALVERTEEGAFFVVDVSEADTAGVAINGQRVLRGELGDGDTIELGGRRIVFELGTASRHQMAVHA